MTDLDAVAPFSAIPDNDDASLGSGDSALVAAAAAIAAGRLATAERIVRERLRRAPTDIAAIIMLARLAQHAGHATDAAGCLRRALDLAPDHEQARRQLARLLYDNQELPEALAELDRLLTVSPRHPGYRMLRASVLDMLGDHDGAIVMYRAMLSEDPAQPLIWMTLGNVLKTINDGPGAIAAFRRSLDVAPATGESWWGLANLKSYRFTPSEIAAMQAELARSELAEQDRICIDFALGKAFEDDGRYARSFAHYSAGNRLQLRRQLYDPEELPALVRRSETLFTPAFFAERAGYGDPSPDPIFIVGMPRSGSTLVEQILACHPAIEATMELPEMPRIVRMLGGGRAAYPDCLARLSGDQAAAIGGAYLRRARQWRRMGRARFIDKLPMNFVSIGLIRLILPNAKIIDVRRHPLGCGLSIFKQYFPKGSAFATDIGHIGRFHADYARMMAMWDAALPGHVRRVDYEDLVADIETEVRRMMSYIGLPFDPACLDFHAHAGIVRTPSAEQVRRPLHGDAVDHWRHYAEWLDPMRRALDSDIGMSGR